MIDYVHPERRATRILEDLAAKMQSGRDYLSPDVALFLWTEIKTHLLCHEAQLARKQSDGLSDDLAARG